jgi:hypothetical protein
MNFSRTFTLGLLLFVSLPALATPKAASTYTVKDLTPTFWRFWDEARGKPEAEQLRLLRERVIAAHPDVYTAEVLTLDTSRPFDEALARRWPRFLSFTGAHLDTARTLSASLKQDLPRYEARFRKTFPDLAYTGEVYFLASIGAFDGGTREVKGRTALLFGVDVIATVYGEKANLEAFFDHELFHIYHEQFPDPELQGTIARALWKEGLATYVGWTLNPETPESVIFGLPVGMPDRARAMLPKLAGELRAKLDSKSPEDYRDFFFGNSKREDIPARSGYYVGYLVARELARDRSLPELARLRGKPLREAIEAALRKLEAAAPASP